MSFQVTTFVNGKRRQNCHIIANSTSDALIVDPGSQPQKIGGLIDGNAWRVHAIINTHGYYDPVGTVAGLMERYQAAFYLHRADEQLLKHANPYRMLFESRGGNPDSPITHDRSRPPSVFEVGPFEVCWILAPGHTNESVCPLPRNFLFSGDSLMRDCVGRTDLPAETGIN